MRYNFKSVARDGAGNIVPSATVSVYLAGTTTVASVYAAYTGGTAVNSVTSGTDGVYEFYVDDTDYAVGQRFKIYISKTGYSSITHDYVTIFDINAAFICTTVNIDASCTASSLGYSELNVLKDGSFVVAGGQTFTIDVPLSAGLHQIFSGAGTVSFGGTKYIEWYGGAADNSTDNAAALTAALVGGGSVELQVGTYKFESKVSHTNSPVKIIGKGMGITNLYWSCADGGLDFDFDNVDDNLIIMDLSIITDAAAGGDAINIDWANSSSSAYNNLIIENVEIHPLAPATDYWTNGIVLGHCWYGKISNVTMRGASTDGALAFSMLTGITMGGGSEVTQKSVAVAIDRVNITACDKGILVKDSCEGPQISQSTIVYVTDGVYVNGNSLNPHLSVQDCHIACFEHGVYLSYLYDGFISNNLIYKRTESTAAFSGIHAVNDCERLLIHGNVISVTTPTTTSGINYGVYLDCNGGNIITNNKIILYSDAQDIGIALIKSTAQGNVVAGNSAHNILATVSDAGVYSNIINNYPRNEAAVAFADGDATPTVGTSVHNIFATANTNPTTITFFDQPSLWQKIIVQIGDANTTFDFTSTHLKGNGGSDWTAGSGDWMEAVYDGTDWLCSVHEI
jgi:hypothetical protein